MSVFLGIDIGSVSVKMALVADDESRHLISQNIQHTDVFQAVVPEPGMNSDLADRILVTKYLRLRGSPVAATARLLEALLEHIPASAVAGVRVCGGGGRLIGELMGVNHENEFRALAHGAGRLYPEISTVFEMGGQTAKYVLLGRDPESGDVGIADYGKAGDCAAGTGSFLDQQAVRLKYQIEDVGDIVAEATRTAKIAGRCSVFAKSDMIHAQQKGYQPPEVLKGLCEAVARNFKSSIMKGKKIVPPVLFVGGVAANQGVANAIRGVFKLGDDQLIVPQYHAWLPAIGTALAEQRAAQNSGPPKIEPLKAYSERSGNGNVASESLSMENVILLRDRIKERKIDGETGPIETYLGIDVGSVSTNLVVLDDEGHVLKEIYTQTEGRPIEVVDRCLKEIEVEIGDRIIIKGVGTTGSGRELIGELVGADTVNDEITAHKTGAEFLGKTMLGQQPDTIFEIGGQDSKFISIEHGIVVDFAMNEACAAGTGSFLEERAEDLGIAIKGEFAQLALSSKSPLKLGERCTVFMQQDVAIHQQRGASKEDLTAGLAYSIVYNYLNRVVRDRHIGDVIFFQGGTAYNDAIASAFTKVLDREIIVPPYNGVIGAVGAALLALEKAAGVQAPSRFRGFSLEKVEYTLREFTCRACSNFCNMQEFTVEGEKTYWGDQCSDKFRRRQTSRKKPVIDDLLGLRRELLFRDYDPEASGKETVGMPRGMYVYEHFPFWNTLFRELGYKVVLSEETSGSVVRAGIEASVAEPCLPIQAYHGHLKALTDKGCDWYFVPNMINAETPFPEVNSHYCPWGQTVPFVLASAPDFEPLSDRILHPEIRFRLGLPAVEKALVKMLRKMGARKTKLRAALDHAYEKQAAFKNALLVAGQAALETLERTGEVGMVLVGRAYNVNDRGMTLDIGSKLRDYYGVNVIPIDFLPVDSVDIADINDNMFWDYGRKILAAAKIVGQHPNLDIIYLTNFKCGPDSYVKHYITAASGKPFLTLQFDGHGNDAGYLTRCEAYLDSKGVLRWWKTPAKSVETVGGAA